MIKSVFGQPIFCCALLVVSASCLTMDGVIVPEYVFQGDAAELRCQFRLDRDTLYSVTWYKDHEEFYRYVPRGNPKQHAYKVDGARIEQHRSGMNVVRLKTLSSAASGIYGCEVSAEAPSFTSASAEARMDVISLPSKGPEITSEVYPRNYREGDLLSLNCTAGKSHPPARIGWFVNEVQTPSWFDSQGSFDYGAVSGLRMRLSREHFARGLLTVRCEASVDTPPPLYKKETFLIVRGSASSISFNLFTFLASLMFHLNIKGLK